MSGGAGSALSFFETVNLSNVGECNQPAIAREAR